VCQFSDLIMMAGSRLHHKDRWTLALASQMLTCLLDRDEWVDVMDDQVLPALSNGSIWNG